MKTIYIDTDFICHAKMAEGRTEIETDVLDNVCDNALSCYKFFPAHDDKVDLCQCINAEMANAIQRQYDEMIAELEDMKSALAELGVTE